jgi:hypothetical protein
MKVNVVLSCDDNPYYSEFWNPAKDIWLKRFGIFPKLIYINGYRQTDNFIDNILYIKKVKGIPVHLQAQLARVYFAQMLKDDVNIISDIDMFPVSREFFNVSKILKNCKGESFYHLNPEKREFGQLPMCYYVGLGSTYHNLIGDFSWEEFLHMIVDKDYNTDKLDFQMPKHLKSKKLWFSDEIYLYSQVLEKNIEVVKDNDLVGARRLDREMLMSPNALQNINYFVDAHLPRPYKNYKTYIDNLYFTLMS